MLTNARRTRCSRQPRAVVAGDFTLGKSDRDAKGRVYGAQENYEVALARGWRLLAWRVGVVTLIVPLIFLTWLLAGVLVAVSLLLWGVVALVCTYLTVPVRWLRRKFPALKSVETYLRSLIAADLMGLSPNDSSADFLPRMIEPIAYWGMHVAVSPLALALSVFSQWFAFREVRRGLLPFLLTRAAICGSGRVAEDGSYHIASKATGLNCVAMCNEFLGRRPIFTFGHFLKAAVVFSVFQDGGFRALWSPHQRLQISLGDSNMCEESEYLRIGATTLVIDMIEAGALPADAPLFRLAIRTLKRFVSDSTLGTTVRGSDGRQWTAPQVQRFYLEACAAFLESRPDAPADAHEVLRRWREVLDLFETNPTKLVGRVDWVTKKFLLDRCADDAGADSWAVRKKIDLRYHEISTEGYFHQLAQTGVITRVLTTDEVERAQGTPPDGSRLAVARGRYIREFSLDPSFKAGWVCVSFGVGPTARKIDLGNESSIDALMAGIRSRG